MIAATRARGAAKTLGAVAAGVGVLAMMTGLLGRQSGLGRMEEALAGDSIDPSQKVLIRKVGTEEANQCLAVGAGTGALPLVLGLMAVGLGISARRKELDG